MYFLIKNGLYIRICTYLFLIRFHSVGVGFDLNKSNVLYYRMKTNERTNVMLFVILTGKLFEIENGTCTKIFLRLVSDIPMRYQVQMMLLRCFESTNRCPNELIMNWRTFYHFSIGKSFHTNLSS